MAFLDVVTKGGLPLRTVRGGYVFRRGPQEFQRGIDLRGNPEFHFLEAPDFARFPCLSLAYDALASGGSAPIALNAANEIVVGAFLAGHARFPDIATTCARTLERLPARAIGSLPDALDADGEARQMACELLALPADTVHSFSIAA